jgi:hypothetical protein
MLSAAAAAAAAAASTSAALFSNISNSKSSDGLVFISASDPARFVLKMHPSHDNSMHFTLTTFFPPAQPQLPAAARL